jgi:hypothetical protein
VVVTHDPAVARRARRIVVMADGRIVAEGLIGSPLEEDLRCCGAPGSGGGCWRTAAGRLRLPRAVQALRALPEA